MANETIGYVKCIDPECNHDAEVRESGKSGLLYIYCDRCPSQTFMRSKEASARLRARMIPSKKAPIAAAVENLHPAPAPIATTTTAPKAADETQPVVTRRRFSSL